MKKNLLSVTTIIVLLLFIGASLSISCSTVKISGHTLKKVSTINLPGTTGKRFDYLTIDYKHHYLLSAHLGADILYVISIDSNKLVKAIPDVPGAEGVEYVPELNKVYTSNWKDHTVGVVDLNLMKVIKKIPLKNKPDGSAYAAPFKKLYVSDERAKMEYVIDVTKDEVKQECPSMTLYLKRYTLTSRTRIFLWLLILPTIALLGVTL